MRSDTVEFISEKTGSILQQRRLQAKVPYSGELKYQQHMANKNLTLHLYS